MINILIANNDLDFSKKIINEISKNNLNVRICNIATDGQEALNILLKCEDIIDIVIMNLDLPTYNGSKILREINENKVLKYEKSIIVLSKSEEDNKILSLNHNPYIFSCVSKKDDFNGILNNIKKLIKIKDAQSVTSAKVELRKNIMKELQKLHYNSKFLGTKYLCESILKVSEMPYWDTFNLEKKIYPLVAKKYNKNVQNIKCNINNATAIMNCECPKSIIMKYFNFLDSSDEPKAKLVISTVLEHL